MKTQIRILMVEDVEADFDLVNWTLHNGGLAFRSSRVESEEGFLRELRHHPPDVILSDHGLPVFDGFQALDLARELCPEVPFIFVTGTMGDDVAVDSLRRGATDYVLKHQLSKLAPSILGALRTADERARWRQIEDEQLRVIRELKEALASVKTITGMLPVCGLCKRIRRHPDRWLDLEVFLNESSDATVVRELCPDCGHGIAPALHPMPPETGPRL